MASTMRNRVLPTLAIVLGFWIIMAVVLLPAIVQATPAYVHCNWLRCLNVLEQDRTGLLTGLPKSTEREKESGLSQVSILFKWGQLFGTPGVDIENFRKLYFMQLLGKKFTAVVALTGSQTHLCSIKLHVVGVSIMFA